MAAASVFRLRLLFVLVDDLGKVLHELYGQGEDDGAVLLHRDLGQGLQVAQLQSYRRFFGPPPNARRSAAVATAPYQPTIKSAIF